MIRSEHVREEMKDAKKVMEDTNANVNDKLYALYKLVTVAIKLSLGIRTNTKLVMNKVGAKAIPPKTQETEDTQE